MSASSDSLVYALATVAKISAGSVMPHCPNQQATDYLPMNGAAE